MQKIIKVAYLCSEQRTSYYSQYTDLKSNFQSKLLKIIDKSPHLWELM